MENQRSDQSRARGTGRPRQSSGNGPSLSSANLNGDDLHGARRRPHRSSHSESQGLEEGFFVEGFGPMQGTRGEIVWFNSTMYEEAEGYFRNSSPVTRPAPLSSSPRDRIHRPLVFRAKRNTSHEEGSPRPYDHQRSSSEPQRGPRRGGRKRVFSETERTPRKGRDKYGTFQGMGRYLTSHLLFIFCLIYKISGGFYPSVLTFLCLFVYLIA